MTVSTEGLRAPARRYGALALAAGVSILLIGLALIRMPAVIALGDTDEAMRLVQLRDFLAGQGWRDLVPHRLDPSFDVPMHWSRFVDLSMAVLYWPLSLMMPSEAAERAMAIIWPSLMLVVCAVPLAFIARRFGGFRAALIAVVLMLGPASLVQFLPGRIDHHSAQMAAALVAIAATMGRNHVRHAAAAGFATAFALSLGIETLPYLIVLACFFASDFMRGLRIDSVRAYAAGLGSSALALFFLTVEPRFFTYTACDTLTLNVLAGVIAGSAGLYVAASWMPRAPSSWPLRLAVAAGLALAAMAVALAIEPRCIRGVIGVFDPQIRPLWFDHIEEVASIFKIAQVHPDMVARQYFIPAIGMMAALMKARSFKRRDDHRVMGVCFAAALLVAALQIRGAFYASVFAVPFIASVLIDLAHKFECVRRLDTSPLVGALAIVGAAFCLPQLAAIDPAKAGTEAANDASRRTDSCNDKTALAPLAALPPGLVLAAIDAGPYILLYTPHAVVSAPYHRFDRGIVLGQSILYTMDVADAERAIRARGIDYIVLCRGDRNKGFASAITHETPVWLHELSAAEAPLRIFRTDKSAAAALRSGLLR